MRKKKVKCPKCKTALIEIVYGFPAPEILEKAERNEIYLGGCCITGFDPKYCCPKCHTEYYEDLKEVIATDENNFFAR